MVLPNSWDKYKDLVQSCLNFKDNIDKAIFQSLVERNSRVQRPKNCHPAIQCTTRQRIIRLLDSKGLTLDIQSLSTACLNSAEDKTVLVLSVLEWSATPFRSGLYRVYTTVRLLRKWKMCGIDVDSCILSFLAESRHCALNKGNIYHVISELVRSQTFSVGRYLQWIMARGLGESFQSGHQKVLCTQSLLMAFSNTVAGHVGRYWAFDTASYKSPAGTRLQPARHPSHSRWSFGL